MSIRSKVLTRASPDGVARYYEGGADDYYQNAPGAKQWCGKGAEMLELAGAPEKRRLREIMAGEVAPGMETTRAYTRSDSKERIGIDLVFDVPKSLSIQSLVGKDAALIEAVNLATQATLKEAERYAQARIKKNGVTRIEHTQNLVIATFRHETNRMMEPHLHTHAVVMNMTRRHDGQWRALHNDAILQNKARLSQFFDNELARLTRAAGYDLRMEAEGRWELAHISRKQITAFSRRSAQIEAELARQGLTRETATAAQKQAATMRTRQKKEHVPRELLSREWERIAREAGIELRPREKDAGKDRDLPVIEAVRPDQLKEAAKAVTFAVNHLTERSSVVTHGALITSAARHKLSTITLPDVEQEIKSRVADGRLIAEPQRYRSAVAKGADRAPARTLAALTAERMKETGTSRAEAKEAVQRAILAGEYLKAERRYTVPAALKRERAILAIEKDGRGKVAPILTAEAAARSLDGSGLNAGQREAAMLVLTTSNRIAGIQGRAGVGKTHLFKEVLPVVESTALPLRNAGYEVRMLAMNGQPVKDMRDAGFTANTVASFLASKHSRNLGSHSVLILDEAGVVPTRAMHRLMTLVEKQGARMIQVGDVGQTKAIEAGRPFDQLQENGMSTAKVTEIQRQRQNERLKEAVELAAIGKASAALGRVSQVFEIHDADQRYRTIAEDYMARPEAERQNTLIVAGTHEARQEIAAHIRELEGLAGQGQEATLLSRHDTTREERRHSKYYLPGHIIEPERDYAKLGLERGKLYRVVDNGSGADGGPRNELTVEDRDKNRLAFNPYNVRQLSVYEPFRAELAVGDRVRLTKNDREQGWTNGDRFQVVAVDERTVTLSDGKRTLQMPMDKALHLDYSHVSTVHGTQGVTAAYVMVHMAARSPNSTKEVFYVGISRAALEAAVYTDDIKGLSKAIDQPTLKWAALDMRREKPHERQADHTLTRKAREAQSGYGMERA